MEVVSGDNWSYKMCKAPVKYCHHQQTNTQFFAVRMPFLSPNQQHHSTKARGLNVRPRSHGCFLTQMMMIMMHRHHLYLNQTTRSIENTIKNKMNKKEVSE